MNPISSQTYVEAADYFRNSQRPEQAEFFYRQGLVLDPEYEPALKGLTTLLPMRGRYAEAERMAKTLLELYPQSAWAHATLCQIDFHRGKIYDAYGHIEQALFLDQKEPSFCRRKAHLLQILGDFSASLEWWSKAIELFPLDPSLRTMRAMANLTLGNWEEGLPEYEFRLAHTPVIPAKGVPRWAGDSPLRGKRLLLVLEQGIGDCIQFVRFTEILCWAGATVSLSLPETHAKALTPLFDWALPFGSIASPDDTDFDYWVPAMSLPLLWKWRSPSPQLAYVRIPKDPVPLPGDAPHVGFCWAGNPEHPNDRYRSIHRSEDALALTSVEGIDGYSLQWLGDGANAAPILNGNLNSGIALTSWVDTARSIEQLDLVVTVDTAIAHLAGAMGKPVWLLVASNPDWRWGLRGEKTNWYPTMKIFRSSGLDNWQPVIERVRADLAALVEERSEARA